MKPIEVVKRLQSDNSKLAKEAILREAWAAGCKDFFIGASLCFNGLVSFGVKQIPEKLINDSPNRVNFDDFLELAEKLEHRVLTGHAARDAINDFIDGCNTSDWNLFYRPILMKDLKCGLSETTINKVLKTLGDLAKQYIIPEMPYQRCSLPKQAKLDQFSWDDGVYSQKKADGMYMAINHYKDGSIDILSRAGKPMLQDEFQSLITDVEKNIIKGTQTHGEFLVFRNGRELPRQEGNGILNSVAQGGKFAIGDTPVYVAWDQISIESAIAKGIYNVAYYQRFEEISKQVAKATEIKLIDTKIIHSMKEAMEHYNEMVNAGYEGTIIKESEAPWKDGTSKFCVKLKLEADIDLVIKDFNAGNGKNEATFGSIKCQTSDGLLEVNVSGFTDEQRVEIASRKEEYIGTIMTVKGNGIMTPSEGSTKKVYSIFLPRWVEFRKDKSVADTLQQVKDQFEAAMENAA